MILQSTGFIPRLLSIYIKTANQISEWFGKAAAWLMLLLVFELVYDTAARYAFNSPTVWSFDVSYMIYAIIFMLGGAYTLLNDEHIRIEFFYDRFSNRGRAILDIIGYMVFFFPPILALLFFGIGFTVDAWKIQEHSTVSYWSPPLYHFKALIPIGAFLLLIQGLAKFITAIALAFKKESH